MAHKNVVHLPERDRDYNEWRGAGWYFVDPTDDEGLNVQGPYATEELADKEYFAYCSAAYG